MGSNFETLAGAMDKVKLFLVALLLVASLVGFYYFANYPVIYRVLGLLGGMAVGVAIAFRTEKGRQIWEHFHDAQIEVRKVVWPTRQETMQTTLVVILMVIVVAIILWLLDMFLGWSIGLLIGYGD